MKKLSHKQKHFQMKRAKKQITRNAQRKRKRKAIKHYAKLSAAKQRQQDSSPDANDCPISDLFPMLLWLLIRALRAAASILSVMLFFSLLPQATA